MLAFVVGEHAARDADFIGEFLLGHGGGFAQRHEALAEGGGFWGFALGHRAFRGSGDA